MESTSVVSVPTRNKSRGNESRALSRPTRGNKSVTESLFMRVLQNVHTSHVTPLFRRKKSVTQRYPIPMGERGGYWYKFNHPTCQIRTFLAASGRSGGRLRQIKWLLVPLGVDLCKPVDFCRAPPRETPGRGPPSRYRARREQLKRL